MRTRTSNQRRCFIPLLLMIDYGLTPSKTHQSGSVMSASDSADHGMSGQRISTGRSRCCRRRSRRRQSVSAATRAARRPNCRAERLLSGCPAGKRSGLVVSRESSTSSFFAAFQDLLDGSADQGMVRSALLCDMLFLLASTAAIRVGVGIGVRAAPHNRPSRATSASQLRCGTLRRMCQDRCKTFC